MRSGRLLSLLCLLLLILPGCGGGGGGGGDSPAPSSTSAATVGSDPPSLTLAPVGSNVMTVTVDGSTCSASTITRWPNKPCVAVTICDSTGATCQTINDIVLDTGDYGLRIFQQAVSQPLLDALNTNAVRGGSPALPLYECVEYGDGGKVWGTVSYVSLQSEQPSLLPIHVIGGNAPSVCQGAYSSPSDAYYNGSLGLGFFAQDCGPGCVTSADNGRYFTCSGSTCTGVAVPLSSQVGNPVAKLAVDNNGAVVELPAVDPNVYPNGVPSLTGTILLGIGTRANNIPPSGVTAYGADSHGNITTVYPSVNGVSYTTSFLDTGSNGYFFPDATIPKCGDWYCPSNSLSLTATTTGSGGAPSGDVTFNIANANTLFSSSNHVFSNIGGPVPSGSSGFVWGLPFFLGRNVYIGLEGTMSGLGEGPYWAY